MYIDKTCDQLKQNLSSGVDGLLRVLNNWLDDALRLQLFQGNSGHRTSYLQSVNQDGNRDVLEARDLLHDSVVLLLVQDNNVLGLVLDLTLVPLFLTLLTPFKFIFGG